MAKSMLQRIFLVKPRLKVFLCSLIMLSCSHTSKRVIQGPNQWKSMPFVAHENWLALNVDPEPITQIRNQIEFLLNSNTNTNSNTSSNSISSQIILKSRGEAHITILTPLEFDILNTTLSIQEINTIAQTMKIQNIQWTPLCVGYGVDSKNSKNSTYFVVVKAEEAINLRKKIFEAYLKKHQDLKNFDPLHFYPHITIGFTDRDLHESDGIIKDVQRCFFDLSTPEGKKLTSW